MRACLSVVSVSMLVASSLALTSLAAAKPSDTKAIAAVIDAQLAGFRDTTRDVSVYASTAMVAMTGGTSTPQVNKLSDAEGKWTIFGPATIGKHKVRDLRVVVARDGNSAWASFMVKITVDGLAKSGAIDYRATELLSRTSSGWQVQAAAWSTATSSAALAKAAKADALPALETVFDQNIGDRDVLGAVKSLASAGLDATAAARTDIVAIGPVAGDVTLGGKKLAAKFKKDWVGKLAIHGATWAITTGTTASATVNVKLTRGDATIPARLFAVFEQDRGGAWSPVIVHLAASAP
jgi:hypothetical protein